MDDYCIENDMGRQQEMAAIRAAKVGNPPFNDSLCVGTMLDRLNDKWGFVDLMPVGKEWRCAATTDEGLGMAHDMEFYGNTAKQAVQRAYRTIEKLYA